MKYSLGIIGIILAIGSLGCSQPFALKVSDIDYEALGSGRLFVSSTNLQQSYYIDVDAKEAFYVPMSDGFAVDGAGKFIYTISGRDIYRAEIGGFKWEKLPHQLPRGSTSNFGVSPDNQKLYFIWVDVINGNQPLVSLDLETGEITDLMPLSDFEIARCSVNPVSGEIAFLVQNIQDSTLHFYRMQGDGSELELLFSEDLETRPNSLPYNVMNWTADGKEIVYMLTGEEYIFRYNLASNTKSEMPFYQDLNYFNASTRIAFSPDGERFVYGLLESVIVENWDQNRKSYGYDRKTITSFCEYSCYTAGKVYWWP
ncbi:MAG: hypothetical protein AB8H47_05110 [Bacteroidia bacterium]